MNIALNLKRVFGFENDGFAFYRVLFGLCKIMLVVYFGQKVDVMIRIIAVKDT